jgi:group I intron endonuclease
VEYIYKITNIKNGKFYIGKSKNVDKRWKEHQSLVGKKRHPFYDSILHYGVENFIIEVVDKTDASLIDDLEIKWILETRAVEIGYNITKGGTGGDTFTNKSDELKEITRKKISIASKESNSKNIELNRKNSIKNWESIEYVNKWRQNYEKAIMKDNYKKNVSEGLKLALQSPELRKKWSECKIGNKNGRALGSVIVTDLEGNETKYETAKDAAKKLIVTAHLIREHCRNNTTFQRGLYKGWKFKFEIK